MEDRPVPYSWEGRQVVASIVEAGGSNPHTYAPYPLEAPERTGILEKVTELGILASLETGTEEEDVAYSILGVRFSTYVYRDPESTMTRYESPSSGRGAPVQG
jgi:hypothetical protein